MEKETISIIGMGCRFPGGANDLETFWKLLVGNHSAISDIPIDRWNVGDYYSKDQEDPGKMYTKKGGFINLPVNKFDAQFFNIPPKEACNLDPQQRLSLEVCYESIEDAFLIPEKLKNSNTGVFLGMSYDEFNVYKKNNICNSNEYINAYSLTGSNFSCAAGRIAYWLGLEGPCMSIDTACSSSLVAVHQAKISLLSGECDLAFAIGVNIILNPDLHIAFCKLKALSADGLCKTFDAKADGYVRSEGCGVIILKRTSDAIKDNNRIHAIIKGTSVNQDGTSDSFTAPSQVAQEKNLVRAYKDAGVPLESVDYIEAHGTGTPLGDAVELNAIANVIGKSKAQRTQPIYIGSVKTNIGHLEPAAGIAGLIKVILSMEKGILPANLNFSQPNQGIDWKNINIAVPTQNIPWNKRSPIISGINSFGFSGTNVHIVVESYSSISNRADVNENLKDEKSLGNSESILCISAKSINAFKNIVDKYINFLHKNKHVKLSKICHSAYTGRTHYEYRLAAVGKTHDEIIDYLLQHQNQVFNSKQKSHNLKQRKTVVFLGNGNKYKPGNLVKNLFKTNQIFKETFIKCDDIIQNQWGYSVWKDCILSNPENITNCLFIYHFFVFTVEYSILKTLESLGFDINIVVGSNFTSEYAFKSFKTKCSIKDALSEIEKNQKIEDDLDKIRLYETFEIPNDEDANSSFYVEVNKKTFVKAKEFSNKNSFVDYIKNLNQDIYHLVDVESGLINQSILKEIIDAKNLSLLGENSGLNKFFIKVYQYGGDLDSLYLNDNFCGFVDLPTYAFDRKVFWLNLKSETQKYTSLPHKNVSIQRLNADSSLDTNDWNVDRLEDFFKSQMDSLINQIMDSVTNQLGILKSKWINNTIKPSKPMSNQIEVWSPFIENNTREWQVICVNSNVSFEKSITIDELKKKLTIGSISPKPDSRTKYNENSIHRMALICKKLQDAPQIVNDNIKKYILRPKNGALNNITTAFMFTGLGEQYEKMGIGLYNTIHGFKDDLDYCFNYIKSSFGFDLKEILFSEKEVVKKQPNRGFDLRAMLGREEQRPNIDKKSINRTLYAHTSILIIQYALGKLLMAYGVKPDYLIGHSLGEYSAACFANVLSIEDAIYLVVKRAEIIEELVPEGRMLAISLSSEKMKSLLVEMNIENDISISLVNSPQSVVVSGGIENINMLERILDEKQILYRQLRSLRGFHSHMLYPIKEKLKELFKNIKFRENEIPYISNVTGGWITKEQCTDPDYWVNHTCSTVEFEKGIESLFDKDLTHLIEIGPGNSLSSFIAQNPRTISKRFMAVLPTMRGVYGNDDDDFFLKKMLARIWTDGANIFDINNNT